MGKEQGTYFIFKSKKQYMIFAVCVFCAWLIITSVWAVNFVKTNPELFEKNTTLREDIFYDEYQFNVSIPSSSDSSSSSSESSSESSS